MDAMTEIIIKTGMKAVLIQKLEKKITGEVSVKLSERGNFLSVTICNRVCTEPFRYNLYSLSERLLSGMTTDCMVQEIYVSYMNFVASLFFKKT